MSATTIRTDVDATRAGVPPAPPEAHQQAGVEDQGRLLACFSLECRVFDREALYRAAMEHATHVDNFSDEDAAELLRPDGAIDVAGCLVMLLDPGSIDGCSVNDSSVALHDLAD